MTNKLRFATRLIGWFAFSMLAAMPVFAQNTSSSISGRVTDAAGKPVAGATVEVLHVPSNTVRTVTTDASGRYAAQGLRVGGPYTVKITGKETAQKSDIYLDLSVESTVNLSVGAPAPAATELAGVTVSASANAPLFQSDNKGVTTTISRDQLDVIPNPDRSIQSIARLNPFITLSNNNSAGGFMQISALGQNFRYNNITIDSVPTNDGFGLNANGLPGQGQPIAYDWIDAYNVNVTNYDVSDKRGVGATIGIVTKSGTNDFHGGVYYDYTNGSDLTRGSDPVTGAAFTGYGTKYTEGAYLSGPIIKDTLFFFAGYEKQQVNCPCGSTYGPSDSNAANTVGITTAQLNQIAQISQGYGIATGGLTQSANQTQDLAMLKLDWNINDNHRMSVRYSEVNGNQPVIQGNATGPNGTLAFASYNYVQYQDNKQFVANLYDDWSDVFSTEASVSYSKYYSTPTTLADAPMVRVYLTGGAGPSVYLGEDQYRDYNVVQDKGVNAYFAGTWHLGENTVKVGFDYSRDQFYDMFGRTEFGSYVFNSISDFAAGNYYTYTLYQPAPGYTLAQIADDYTQYQYGLFAQDTWQATDRLSMTLGLRYDVPQFSPATFYNAAFAQAYGMPNNVNPGTGQWQPRFSFNYQFDTQRMTQLRGGVGVVEGAPPGVWLANPYSNNGITTTSYNGRNGVFNPNPYTQVGPPSTPPTPEVDVTAPGFKLPSAIKMSLGFDRELPWWGMVLSGDLIHLQTQNGILYENLNYPTQTGTLPDGRVSMWASTDPSQWTVNANTGAVTVKTLPSPSNPAFYNVVYLANTNKGSSNYAQLTLSKPFTENLSGSLTLVGGRSTDVNSGTSSQAASSLNSMAITNPNQNVASNSNYDVRERILANLTWKHRFFGDYDSAISATYDGHSGQPYSWVFGNDANGMCFSSPTNCPYQLAFIPRQGQVEFTPNTSQQVISQFYNYIQSNSYLRDNQGGIAQRNGAFAPWVNQLNLSFSQEIPGIFPSGAKGVIKVDIYNFLNVLNKKWGAVNDIDYPNQRTLAYFAGVDPTTGKYVYSLPVSGGNYNPAGYKFENQYGQSQWTLWVTVKYAF